MAFLVTTRAVANQWMGGGEPPSSHDGDEVVLVQLIGTFELNSAPRPPGARSPSGKYMLIAVDVATGQGYATGLTPAGVDLPAATVLYER